MIKGTVVHWNQIGFGFIRRDDGRPDAYVHQTAVRRAGLNGLAVGDRLTFELMADEKRPGKFYAVNLKPESTAEQRHGR